MAKRIDWDGVERAYVQRNPKPTTIELAAEFLCTRENVSRKCSKGGWDDKRTVFQERVKARREEKTVEALSDVGAEFDKQCFTLAQWLLSEAYNERKVNLGKIFEVAKSVEIGQRVGKTALGDTVKPPDDARMSKVEEVLVEYANAIEANGSSATPDGNSAEQPVHPSEAHKQTG